jgi:hypothetical protein
MGRSYSVCKDRGTCISSLDLNQCQIVAGGTHLITGTPSRFDLIGLLWWRGSVSMVLLLVSLTSSAGTNTSYKIHQAKNFR